MSYIRSHGMTGSDPLSKVDISKPTEHTRQHRSRPRVLSTNSSADEKQLRIFSRCKTTEELFRSEKVSRAPVLIDNATRKGQSGSRVAL